MILNLNKSFKPFKGKEIKHESFTFSDGEPHIKILDTIDTNNVTITHRLNSFNDLGLLLIAIDALKRMFVKNIELFIPYFPAARQDRVMIEGEALTVKVYADIINSLNLDKITIFDPHSEVSSALLNNCVVVNNHKFISHVVQQLPNDLLLVSPDGRALKKIHKLAMHLENYQVLECGKKRDVKSGSLSGFKVPEDDLQGKDCLIVDDICDGGGTFLGLSHELKKRNSGNLFLAISHGIFSKGLEKLESEFEQIFTTDSIGNIESEKLNYILLDKIISHEI